MPPQRSNGRQHAGNNKREEIQRKFDVPRVEGGSVGEAVHYRENEERLPRKRLQEVADSVEREHLVGMVNGGWSVDMSSMKKPQLAVRETL